MQFSHTAVPNTICCDSFLELEEAWSEFISRKTFKYFQTKDVDKRLFQSTAAHPQHVQKI